MKKDQCLLQSLYFPAAAFQRTSDQSIGLPEQLGMLKIFFLLTEQKGQQNCFDHPFSVSCRGFGKC